MTFHIIGRPGGRPRMIYRDCPADTASDQVREGEVSIQTEALGDYVISADGTMLEAYQPATEEQWREIRIRRAALLSASDWTQMPDVSEATRSAWADFRQQLRDITQFPTPANVVWPTEPGSSQT